MCGRYTLVMPPQLWLDQFRDTLNKAWFELNCVFQAAKVVRTAVWELLARSHP